MKLGFLLLACCATRARATAGQFEPSQDQEGGYEADDPETAWGTVQAALNHMGDSWDQLQCNRAYKALFPGSDTTDAGPCKSVMASNFKSGTCMDAVCRPIVEDMLSACIGWRIPDFPPGNPLAGRPFRADRAAGIRAGMNRAGCHVRSIKLLQQRRPTRSPTPAPTPHDDHTMSPTPAPPTPAPTPLPRYKLHVSVWSQDLATFGEHEHMLLETAVVMALGLNAKDSRLCAQEQCVHVSSVLKGTTAMSDEGAAVPKLSSLEVTMHVQARTKRLDDRLGERMKRLHFKRTLVLTMRKAGLHTQPPALRGTRKQRSEGFIRLEELKASRDLRAVPGWAYLLAAVLAGSGSAVVCAAALRKRLQPQHVHVEASMEERSSLRWDATAQLNLPSMSALMAQLALNKHTRAVQRGTGASSVRDLVEMFVRDAAALKERLGQAGLSGAQQSAVAIRLDALRGGITREAAQQLDTWRTRDDIEEMENNLVTVPVRGVGSRPAVRPLVLNQNTPATEWRNEI